MQNQIKWSLIPVAVSLQAFRCTVMMRYSSLLLIRALSPSRLLFLILVSPLASRVLRWWCWWCPASVFRMIVGPVRWAKSRWKERSSMASRCHNAAGIRYRHLEDSPTSSQTIQRLGGFRALLTSHWGLWFRVFFFYGQERKIERNYHLCLSKSSQQLKIWRVAGVKYRIHVSLSLAYNQKPKRPIEHYTACIY